MAWSKEAVGRNLKFWDGHFRIRVYNSSGNTEHEFSVMPAIECDEKKTFEELAMKAREKEEELGGIIEVKWYQRNIRVTFANGEKRLYLSPNASDYRNI